MSPDITQAQADDLIVLARARFVQLSAAETKLLEAAPKGEVAVCGPNGDRDDPRNDPAEADEWSAEREIRAELIRWVCVDHAARDRVDPKGIQAFGARVVGKLDLSSVTVPFRLALGRCRLMEDAELYSTDLLELNLEGTWVRSLKADAINVKGGVFLRKDFRAEGQVRLLAAQIGGNLECGNSVFTNPSEVALHADGINVKGDVFLQNGFRAEGEVRLLGAQIGGDLSCVKAKFDGELTSESTTTKGALFWTSIVEPERAKLDLMNSQVGALVDDRRSWPAREKLWLDGFVYERFSGSDTPRSAEDRLDWLALQENFAPQPYRQLAKVLRDEGDDRGARKVLFEMERLRRKKEDSSWLRRSWSRILRLTIGFGYYPGWSLLWLLGLTVLGTILLWSGYAAGSVAPADKEAYGPFKQTSQLPPHYERFHASVYALENSFPLVKLGQTERWQPDPNPGWQCSSAKGHSRPLCWIVAPSFLRVFRWVQICLGWFFTTMFVAGVTGIVRKD